jgi:uncharacterized repeat protein (TIGR03837 family)
MQPDVEPTAPPRPLWDVFCRVIDNRGDAGVAWRLARNLALRGQRVRLWIDLPDALDGMADAADERLVVDGQIAIAPWSQADARAAADADVVVETFGCTLPDAVLRTMASRVRAAGGPPAWINLEYLSAEAWVDRSHGLPSPRLHGPAAGLVTWFWFPGFTPATGGLLREPWIGDADPAPAADGWRPRPPGEPLVVSRFDYGPAAAMAWLGEWAARRGAAGLELHLSAGVPGATDSHGLAASDRLVVHAQPWLTQAGFDIRLQQCDLNIVRGEDSFVRAQWAGRPMLWHVYPQSDGAHAAKLEAWLDRYLDDAPPLLAGAVRQAHRAWNGLAGAGASPVEALLTATDAVAGWAGHARRWRQSLLARRELTTDLIAFARGVRVGSQQAGTAG